MAVNVFNNRRISPKKKNSTAIITSQRSSCVAVFYRWANTDISKLNILQAENEKIAKGNNSTDGNLNDNKRIVIVKNDVIRCSITKNKASNSGQFSLTLKRGKEIEGQVISSTDINYLEVLHPGDWVMIYLTKTGEVKIGSTQSDSGLKMLGIVENVRYVEIDDPTTGKPRLEYIVSGKDFGKVFDMDVFFNPIINQQTAASLLGIKFLQDAIGTVKGNDRGTTDQGSDKLSPDNVIKKLVSFYLGANNGLDALNKTNEAWYIPKTLAVNFRPETKSKKSTSFVDILDISKIGLHKYINGKLSSVDKLPGATFIKALPSTGTVWSILQSLQNSIVNEMYTELVKDSRGNLKPSLILRQVPFSNRKGQETNTFTQAERYNTPIQEIPKDSEKTYFVDLPRFNIVSSDIKEKNIGKSDFERINHVVVVPRIDGPDALDIAYQAAVNIPSIQRYGLRTFQGATSYTLDSARNFLKMCQFCLHLMIDWLFLSHEFYNGTIVIDGTNEHIQLGTNLYIQDIGQLFHIEGVNHTYEQGADGRITFNTSLTVTRGQFFLNNTSRFIGPSSLQSEPTTISTSVREGVR